MPSRGVLVEGETGRSGWDGDDARGAGISEHRHFIFSGARTDGIFWGPLTHLIHLVSGVGVAFVVSPS